MTDLLTADPAIVASVFYAALIGFGLLSVTLSQYLRGDRP